MPERFFTIDCETHLWDLRDLRPKLKEADEFLKSLERRAKIITGKDVDLTYVTVDDLLKMMDEAGIDVAVCLALGFKRTFRRMWVPNELVAEAMRRAPNRIIGFGYVNPLEGEAALLELEHIALELGLKGLKLYPLEGFYPNDERVVFPVYEKCVELGIRNIAFHMGRAAMPNLRLRYAHPIYLDDVAECFPELNIICFHAAYPWVDDLIAVAGRNRNIMIAFSYVCAPITWAPYWVLEMLGKVLRELGSDRVCWGSDWPTYANVKEQLEALRSMRMPEELQKKYGFPELTDDVKRKFFGENLAKILGVEVKKRVP